MTHQDILYRAAYVRGYFINQVSYIEKMIEFFIANHFCKDKERAIEMIDLLTGDRFVSFESKRTTFEFILKRHHNSVYLANKKMFENLTTVQNERNRLAHLMVYTIGDAEERYVLDGSIAFIKFNDKTKPIWYSTDKIKGIFECCDNLVSWLNKLVNT